MKDDGNGGEHGTTSPYISLSLIAEAIEAIEVIEAIEAIGAI